MRQRALAFGLMLISTGVWLSTESATAQSRPRQSVWLRTESQHFEIHYLPALAPELDAVVRSAERAFDQISRRLDFVFGKKVPLVMFAATGALTRDEVVAYAISDDVAPQQPHRSRIVLPLSKAAADLDSTIVHELTHLLMYEVILPGTSGDGGLPRWVREGLANYMVGVWRDDDERLMRELVASGNVPALSQMTGDAGLANARLNDTIGHAAFDYLESRWGATTSIRRFLNTLIVPRVNKTYDSVFGLTPTEFDAAFREYTQRRFSQVAR